MYFFLFYVFMCFQFIACSPLLAPHPYQPHEQRCDAPSSSKSEKITSSSSPIKTSPIPPKVTPPPKVDKVWQSFKAKGLYVEAKEMPVLYKTLKLLENPTQVFKVIHYGDSHSQVNWFSRTVARTLQPKANVTPGFVHVGHPQFWSGKVTSTGYWLRQNWLYSKDHAPFGPLGISMVTQDQNARLNMRLDVKHEHPMAKTVHVYYETGKQRLPFCIKVLKDLEKISTAQKSIPEKLQLQIEALPLIHTTQCVPVEADEILGMKYISTQVPAWYQLEVYTKKGIKITNTQIQKRTKARRRMHRLKRRARKRKKKFKTKLASYAQFPHVIDPKSNYLKIFGFRVYEQQKSNHHIPQIEWNTLAVSGSRVYSPTVLGSQDMIDYIKEVQPQLLVLWYGSNSVAADAINLKRYASQYSKLIKKLKSQAPQAMCLAIGPPDFGRRDQNCFLNKRERRLIRRKRKSKKVLQLIAKNREARICNPDSLVNQRKRGRYRYPVPNVRTRRQWKNYVKSCQFHLPTQFAEIIQIQKRIALQEGCAYFDPFEAMGGEGSIQQWACHEERLAQYDLIHLNSDGYNKLGRYLSHLLKKSVHLEHDVNELSLKLVSKP